MSSINGITIGSSVKRLACVVLFGGVACSIPERTLAPADTGGSGGSSNSGGSGTGATSGSSGTSGSAGNTGGMGNAGGAGNSGSGGSAAIGGMGGSSANGGSSGASGSANAGAGGSAGCASPKTVKFRVANLVNDIPIYVCLRGEGNFNSEPVMFPAEIAFGEMTAEYAFENACNDVVVKILKINDCNATAIEEHVVTLTDELNKTIVHFHDGIGTFCELFDNYPPNDEANRFRVINGLIGPNAVDFLGDLGGGDFITVFSDVMFGSTCLDATDLGIPVDSGGYVEQNVALGESSMGVAETNSPEPFVTAPITLNLGESITIFSVGHYLDPGNPAKIMICNDFLTSDGFASCGLFDNLLGESRWGATNSST